jgi:hypothetical protein
MAEPLNLGDQPGHPFRGNQWTAEGAAARDRYEKRWPHGPEMDAFAQKYGPARLESDLHSFWQNQDRTGSGLPSLEFQTQVTQAGSKRIAKERRVEKQAAKDLYKPQILEQLQTKHGYTEGDTVFDSQTGTRGTVKWGRDGQPFVQSNEGKHYVGSRWKKAQTLSYRAQMAARLVGDDLVAQVRALGGVDLDTFLPELSAFLMEHGGTINLGGPGSGNFGHAGRPGEVGGSADSGDSSAPGHGDHVTVPVQPDLGRARPTPIQVQSVAEAVGLILKGKVVELQDVAQVHTVLTRLAGMAQEAKAKGEHAPKFDLCNVSVKGSNLFCGDKLRTNEFPNGVPRVQMPQFSGEARPGSDADKLPKTPRGRVVAVDAFVQHLKDVGIKTSRELVPAAGLRATQMEMKGDVVARMMTDHTFDPAHEPMFISRDNYVIDGHHRWAAVVGRDAEDGHLGDSKLKVVRIDAPISEILHRANWWTKEFGLDAKAGHALREYAARVFSLLDDRFLLGGEGSGNFGHAGRPGEVGGSAKGDSAAGAQPAPSRLAEAKVAVAAAAAGNATPPLQPIVPPQIPAAAVAKAKALLAADPKTPVEQVLDALDGNSREQFDQLLTKATKADSEMGDIVSRIKRSADVETVHGPVKKLDRAVAKAVGKDTGDARIVRDVVRSSIAVDNVNEIDKAIVAVHEAVKATGSKILTADDRFNGPPTDAGYRDFSVNVRLPSGVIGEIQMHLRPLLKAKDEAGPGRRAGHVVYKDIRELAEKPTRTPAEDAKLKDLLVESNAIYHPAWIKAGGK